MATIYETTDAGLWDETIYTIEAGDTFVGESFSPYADDDSIRVNLVAGVTYTFTMTSTSDNWAHNFNLELGLPEAFALVQTSGNDSSPAVLTFTASATGTFYLTTYDQTIDVNESSYQISMTSSGAPAPTGPTEGDDDLTGASNSDTLDLMGGNDSFAAGNGSDNVSGGAGNDTIMGESGKDTLQGGEGDDYLDGGSGEDLILGGGGNDTLLGGLSADVLEGGDDNDMLDGGDHDDQLSGDAGNDTLFGGRGNDVLEGGADADVFVYEKRSGNDTISDFEDGSDLIDVTDTGAWDISELTMTQNGADVVIDFAGAHSLTIEGTLLADLSNADFILADAPAPTTPSTSADGFEGTAGADSFDGGAGSDVLNGLGGNDTLNGGSGQDTINGGTGRDLIDGGTGNDDLSGGNARDTINGGDGADMINGGAGSDFLYGGNGNDNILGGGGHDTINGDSGDDMISGQSGRDVMNGGAGDDTLDGGNSTDTLIGGEGDDALTGGDAADVFVFATGHGNDTVTDFEDGIDLFDITGLDIGLQNLIVSNTVTIADGAIYDFVNGSDSITVLNNSGNSITLDGSDYIWDNIFVVG